MRRQNKSGARIDMPRTGIVHGSGHFEDNDLRGLYSEGNAPETVSSGHPVRFGTYSMRAYLHRTESPTAYRTMVVVRADDQTPFLPRIPHTDFHFDIFGEYWIGFSIHVQSDLVSDPPELTDVVFQVQRTPDAGPYYRQPCVALAIDTLEEGGELVDYWRIWRLWDTRQSDPGKPYEYTEWFQMMLPMDPADIGGWTDWVFHIIWDWHNNGDGLLQAWRNGVEVLNVEGGNCSNEIIKGPYMSFGEYKWAWRDETETNSESRLFYFDQFRIGDSTASYDDVKPGPQAGVIVMVV